MTEQVLFVTATTDRRAYAPGAPVVVTIEIRAPDGRGAVIARPTSQRYDLSVADAEGRTVWRWSEGRMFAQRLDEDRLAAGERRELVETFPAPATPGDYVLTATIITVEARVAVQREIAVRAAGGADDTEDRSSA